MPKMFIEGIFISVISIIIFTATPKKSESKEIFCLPVASKTPFIACKRACKIIHMLAFCKSEIARLLYSLEPPNKIFTAIGEINITPSVPASANKKT